MKKNKPFVHESSFIEEKVDIGSGTKIWHFCHILENTSIGENSTVGQNCMIGPNVRIGRNTKLQNNVSLYDGVIAEDNVFFGPSAVTTNVINPRSKIERKDKFLRTYFEEGVSVGANATIICGLTLKRNCFIAAGALVTKDVKQNALMMGVPAKQVGWMSDFGETLDDNLYCKSSNTQYFINDEGDLEREKDLRIGLITYDINHLKTQLIAEGLQKKGYKFDLITTEFSPFEAREIFFQHRPEMLTGLYPQELSEKYNCKCFNINEWDKFNEDYDYFLIGGSRILEDKKLFKRKNIINCHSGLIPYARGLDSFKWAIFNQIRVGNSLHFIDDKTDLGELKYSKETVLFKEDTLETYAARHFVEEIKLLVNFENYLDNEEIIDSKLKVAPAKRMPKDKELKLESNFNKMKEEIAI